MIVKCLSPPPPLVILGELAFNGNRGSVTLIFGDKKKRQRRKKPAPQGRLRVGAKTGGGPGGNQNRLLTQRGSPIWIWDPDMAIQDWREGCYTQVRFSDNRIQTRAGSILDTSSYNTDRTTDASCSSRWVGGTEREGYIAVDATTDADDTSNQPNHAATLGVCPRPDQGEVQGLYHPSPGNHRGIAAAPEGDGQSQHRAGGWRHKVNAGHYSSSWGAVPAGGNQRTVDNDTCHILLRSVFGKDYWKLVPSLTSLRQRCPWLQLQDSPWRWVTSPYFSS